MSGAILITGATSGIGSAVAERLARDGRSMVLAGRDAAELQRVADDLAIRHGAEVETRTYDALDAASHEEFFAGCARAFPDGLEGVIVCHGYLGSQQVAERDPGEARAIVDVNFTSCVALLNIAAEHLASCGRGFLCAVSSVAGDRGRPSNYIYGSAKGGLNTYLDGLRCRMFRSGVAVTTVKPGFVDTSMTYGLPGMFLVADRDRVAGDILRAIRKRKAVVYTPWFWRYIMLIIRTIPGPIFKRMKL